MECTHVHVVRSGRGGGWGVIMECMHAHAVRSGRGLRVGKAGS